METLMASSSSTAGILCRPRLPLRPQNSFFYTGSCSPRTTAFTRKPLFSNHGAERKLIHSFQTSSSSSSNVKLAIKYGVTEINESQFSEVVLKSDRPVLVEFVATWCGPCRLIAPAVDSIAQEYEEKLLVVKIDHDSNPKLIKEYKVYGLPALILFKDGREIPESRREGAITKAKLKDYVDALLKSIGSTKWVDQNLVNLGSKAVAYINVDCAVQGPGLFAATTPQLDDILVEVTKKVTNPDFSDSKLFEKWRTTNDGPLIQRLSDVFSDFAPFLHHAGVPSIDLYYGKDFPVYHTVFDSYEWMVKYGDPFFHRHVAVAGVWGLLGLHLADDPILPFNYLSYANQLQNYTHSLESLLEGGVSLHPITSAIQELEDASKQVQYEMKKMREEETEGRVSAVLKRRMLNDRLMFAERGFLDSEGIQGRTWFNHLVNY